MDRSEHLETDVTECEGCAGRGWIGGALRTRDTDGNLGLDVNAYKIMCSYCKGTGRSNCSYLTSELEGETGRTCLEPPTGVDTDAPNC